MGALGLTWVLTRWGITLGFSLGVSLGGGLLASGSAWAESQEMSAARNLQGKAYQDYYQRLRHGGAQASPEKTRQAYDATAAPAEREAGTALQNEFRISSKNAFRANRVFLPPVQALQAAPKGESKVESKDDSKAPVSDQAEVLRPETALDGNGIAREIEFKGSKKK